MRGNINDRSGKGNKRIWWIDRTTNRPVRGATACMSIRDSLTGRFRREKKKRNEFPCGLGSKLESTAR